jgi:hypothetical protein
MWLGEDFWGTQGRIARVRGGGWPGRFVFIYPEVLDDRWVMVIDPSPTPGVSGEQYIDDGSYLERLAREWDFEWVPLGPEEEKLEREHFGWRPLEDYRNGPVRHGWRSMMNPNGNRNEVRFWLWVCLVVSTAVFLPVSGSFCSAAGRTGSCP